MPDDTPEAMTIGQAINHVSNVLAKAKTTVGVFVTLGPRAVTMSTASKAWSNASRVDDAATRLLGVYDPTCPEQWVADDIKFAFRELKWGRA